MLVWILRKLGYNSTYYYFQKHEFGYDEERKGNKLFISKNGKINRILYVIYSIYFILKYDIFIFSGYYTLLPSHFDL